MSKVAVYIDPEKMREDLTFSDVDIQSAMMNQSSLFAWYSVQAIEAKKQSERFKMLLDITESRVSKNIRDKAASEGVKLTEPNIAAMVARTESVINARMAYNDAKAQAELGKHVLEALKQRRDMLVQIGVAQREEKKGKLRINEDPYERAKKFLNP